MKASDATWPDLPTAPAWLAGVWSKLRANIRGAAVLLAACLSLSLLLWAHPEFLLSSDSLFPAAFVWDATHRGDAWSGLQQPHIPSFFPDLLVQGTVQALTGSWRTGVAAWVFVALAWLATLLTWITARLARPGPAASPEAPLYAVLSLLVLMIGAAALGLPRFTAVAGSDDPFLPWLFVLVPYTHGGPFLLALTTAALARRAIEHPSARKLALLALLSWAVGISDQLCLISLMGPLMAALLGALLIGTVTRTPALLVLSAVWGGTTLGFVCADRLDRQFMPLPEPSTLPAHMARFVADLGHQPVVLATLAGLALALAVDARQRGVRGFLGGFWPVFAATGALGSLALTALLYEDVWSYRYALPALWWGFLLTAAALTRLGFARVPVALAAGVVLAAGLARDGFGEPRAPGLLTWDSPLAACLRETGAQAGLADYWYARKTSAATDWRLQVDPIDDFGQARVWGNNRQWFAHDLSDPSRRPPYRFIIMERLPPERIAAVYGPPDRTVTCGGSLVWLYDEDGRVNRGLERASPFLADVFAAAPPR